MRTISSPVAAAYWRYKQTSGGGDMRLSELNLYTAESAGALDRNGIVLAGAGVLRKDATAVTALPSCGEPLQSRPLACARESSPHSEIVSALRREDSPSHFGAPWPWSTGDR